MMLPWTLVAVVLLTLARFNARIRLLTPEMVVVPVPLAAPNPMMFPLSVKKFPLELMFTPAYVPLLVKVRVAVW